MKKNEQNAGVKEKYGKNDVIIRLQEINSKMFKGTVYFQKQGF